MNSFFLIFNHEYSFTCRILNCRNASRIRWRRCVFSEWSIVVPMGRRTSPLYFTRIVCQGTVHLLRDVTFMKDTGRSFLENFKKPKPPIQETEGIIFLKCHCARCLCVEDLLLLFIFNDTALFVLLLNRRSSRHALSSSLQGSQFGHRESESEVKLASHGSS